MAHGKIIKKKNKGSACEVCEVHWQEVKGSMFWPRSIALDHTCGIIRCGSSCDENLGFKNSLSITNGRTMSWEIDSTRLYIQASSCVEASLTLSRLAGWQKHRCALFETRSMEDANSAPTIKICVTITMSDHSNTFLTENTLHKPNHSSGAIRTV
jgi:hypothetical protein